MRSTDVTIPSLTGGAKLLLVAVDAEHAQAEVNEDNNLLALPIYVTALPRAVLDLHVDSDSGTFQRR